MPKRTRIMSGSASARKRRRYGPQRRFKPTYVRSGFGAIGRTPGGAVLGEMKYFDTAYTGSVASDQGWVGTNVDQAITLNLCSPTVGAGVNQRIGKQIKVLKIKIHGSIAILRSEAETSATYPSNVRLSLVMDKQTNASQMLGNQIYSAVTGQTAIPLTFQNIDNFGRFSVLKDKLLLLQDPNMVSIDTGTNYDKNGLIRNFKITHKFKVPVNVRFNAVNGGTIADIIDNSFHVVANSTANNTILSYLCRVSYKE